MTGRFEKLFEPFNIGPLRVRNRIVMPPMVVGYAGPHGEVTEQLIAYYEARARGGVGLVIVEASYVSPEGKLVEGELGVYDDSLVPGLARLADAIKIHGAAAAVQIAHGGLQSKAEPVGPSAIPRRVIPPPTTPRELSTREVEELVDKFAAAAERVKRAGFDAVEVHGTHGYLITQFLSPLTNRRTDKYGADRALFAVEVVERIKERCGKAFPVIFRLNSSEFIEGGITVEDAKKVARRLEEAGVDAFDVTGGNYDTADYILMPYYYVEEGWFFKLAKEVKSVVSVPIISGGLVTSPEVAERAIAEGYVDAVFLGRQLIADPEWPKKVAEGRVADIRPCIMCNEGCIGNRVFMGKPTWCTVNPLSGWEYRWRSEEEIPRASVKKRVLIIGGGPAGLEAARVAALRGHEVTLVDENEQLGGILRYTSKLDFKQRLAKLVAWYERQLERLGVKVVKGRRADEGLLEELKPDVVVVATGSKPLTPKIPGVENAVMADDVLLGKVQPGAKVVIVGGGLVGVELALHLAKQGKDVTVVEALPEIARDLEPISKIALTRPRGPWPEGLLWKYNVKVLTSSPVVEVRKDGVVVVREMLRLETIPADTVILAVGRVANVDPALLEAARRVAKEVYVIGDAKSPRKVIDAIHEGFFTALSI